MINVNDRISFFMVSCYALGFDFKLLMSDAPIDIKPRVGAAADGFWWDFSDTGVSSRHKCLRYLLSREEWVSFGNGQ